ncbi:MAG: NAD-dependent epimerase/dehydratase family protein, partial [Geminicoccaceae bacterium]
MGGVALVTGGAGFVGRHLVRLLQREGQQVRVLDPAPPFTAEVEWQRGSVLVPADLEAAFAQVDVVFHLAAEARLGVPEPRRYHALNVEGTEAVLAMAERRRVRRIVVTSTATLLRGWNDPDPSPLRSTDRRPNPAALAGPYSRSKLAAENLALAAAARGLSVHLIHPTVPIGPDDPTPTPPTAMLRLFATQPPPFYLAGFLNLVAVEDVALAHHRAAQLD